MRRPLCVFCVGVMGLALVCSFLPQVGLLLPLAAFLLAGLVWLWVGGAACGYGVWLMLGAAVGTLFCASTRQQLERLQTAYAGRTVTLVAEVENVSSSYYDGVVNAVLYVRQTDGRACGFRVECVCLAECEAGQRVTGRFALEVPDETQQLNDYADGVALSAECLARFSVLGRSDSFRARTARLQKRLSEAMRTGLDEQVGGVLAAMIVGDRGPLTQEMNDAYRAAGLSHVLVVSGMHVSILCGDLFAGLGRTKRSGKAGRREQSHLARKAMALFRALLALILVGVTGFTPSVLRAAVAVWIASLGVFVGGEPDALTSLALAGFFMTQNNSYAACDIGFELSFAAVAGTLAGGECSRRGKEYFYARRKAKKLPGQKRTAFQRAGDKLRDDLWEMLCVSSLASAATFPVLVLRGLSVSLYALVSSIAVLWFVTPLMLFGIAAALLGLVPFAWPLQRLCALCAALLTRVLNQWAIWVAAWPGAQIGFDTACAAIICLLLLGLLWLAVHWRVRARVAVPCFVVAATLSLGAGIALDHNVARVELVGSRTAPAAVITQNGQAVVLFRGGASTQRAVETVLSRRGVRQAAVLVDLRMDPGTRCTLPARSTISAAQMDAYATRHAAGGDITVEVFRTRSGCVVRVLAAGRSLVAVSGSAELATPISADWLLASASSPDAVRWRKILTLSTAYRWMDADSLPATHSVLALRPGGGERLN